MYDYYYDFDYSPYLDTYPSSTSSDIVSTFGAAAGAFFATFAVFFIGIIIVSIIVLIARWKLFKKAGRKPWESLIPIHSDIVEFELGGIETYWYFVNYVVLIPFLGWFFGWIAIIAINFWRCIALSKSFGKSTGFGVLMGFFPFVAYPMLAFGNSQYIGPQTNTSSQNYSNNNFNNNQASNNGNMNNYNSYQQPTMQNQQSNFAGATAQQFTSNNETPSSFQQSQSANATVKPPQDATNTIVSESNNVATPDPAQVVSSDIDSLNEQPSQFNNVTTSADTNIADNSSNNQTDNSSNNLNSNLNQQTNLFDDNNV